MKTAGIVSFIIGILLAIVYSYYGVIGRYQLSKDLMSYWNLADKASTIAKKSEYIDKFVKAIDMKNYHGQFNAVYWNTPNNNFGYNYEMLKSFQTRLHEIQGMDITSFQYQTAIQQITQQEQGEAGAMIGVFEGIWWKSNYFLLWDWVCVIGCVIISILIIGGGLVWLFNSENF